jgi:holo-[acyl-carrier protein] synthase
MQSVGVDIIEIERVEDAFRRFGQRFLDRVYTKSEILLCRGKGERLAARFAGKEAIMKVLGTGVKGVGWREIEILAKPSGEPTVHLYGRARATAESIGLDEFCISLSHSKEYAVASAFAQTRATDAR